MDFIFILFLLIVLFVVVAIAIIIRLVKRKITNFFGRSAQSLIQTVVNQQQTEELETPRSLSNLESIYLPMIRKKYPDLQPDDLRNNAGIVLKEYLDSIQKRTPTSGLTNLAAKSLCDSVRVVSGEQYKNQPYLFHQALISAFSDDRIRFDVAYKTDKQRKASVTFCYMKENRKEDEEPLEQHCQNCGAVLTPEAQAVGYCLYCEQVFKQIRTFDWLAVQINVTP